MSLFCSSSSTSGSFVSKVALRHALPFLYPFEVSRTFRSVSQEDKFRHSKSMVSSAIGLEAWFIKSLANAGNCRNHTRRTSQTPFSFSSGRPHISNIRHQKYGGTSSRYQHTKEDGPVYIEDCFPDRNRTREELMELVDQYSGDSYTDQLPVLELPSLYQPSDGPQIVISDKIEDEWPPPHYAWPANKETQIKIGSLRMAIKDESQNLDELYRLYRALPGPRAPYLDSKTRHKMLHRLAVVENKDEHSMLRYLSIVDDMKGTAIPLSTTEWTSAISFAARYTARSTDVEVEAALRMWREMEHVAGVKGNGATFNVLFDVACKAGKFTLAEMIYKEMENRKLPFDRYHHVSLIFFHGLRRNGDAAREAYRNLVEAGEIVDTVVLNAMISALIRSHESQAAENIYERMKRSRMDPSEAQIPPPDFKARRVVTKSLKKMAIVGKYDKSKQEEYQRRSTISPDHRTFQILINHFAVDAGELDKTAQYLDEMKWLDISVRGEMFYALLKGFASHGGIRYTRWTDVRLEGVWGALIQALDDKVEGLYISKWLIVWALKAFAKCSGKSRVLKVWEEIEERWDPGEVDLSFVMDHLRSILDGPDMAEKRHDWLLGSL